MGKDGVARVELALRPPDERRLVALGNEKKPPLVGNLLAVLCADEPLTPTLNATV